MIGSIISSMRVEFKAKFEKINESFERIFKQLFGGGRARISLEEGYHGVRIEIDVEPPGKKLQHISLLSGGERALGGIALLFAMIEINPSPVCLLDEIDAPLDEANGKLGTYLRSIHSSQFLMITHKKQSMAICDVLFGVAMEEKGRVPAGFGQNELENGMSFFDKLKAV